MKSNLCTTCPRRCNVARNKIFGICNESEKIRIAKIIKHFQWEEPCLASSEKGCLAIFFSGCNLRCSYCQNHQISRGGVGDFYTIDEFCKLIEQEQENHSSIDLITPTHFSNQLYEAFSRIEKKVPVIWNTNGYETTENIEKVSSFVDIFLTDFKYASNNLGMKFSKCNDYFHHALESTKLMCSLKEDKFHEDILTQGVIIRHLVLPKHVKNSFEVLDVIKANFPERIISIMSQFTPNRQDDMSERLTPLEYKAVLAHMQKLGLSNGYIQEFDSAAEDFVPKFV